MKFPVDQRSTKAVAILIVAVASLSTLAYCKFAYQQPSDFEATHRVSPPSAEEIARNQKLLEIQSGGEFYQPLKMMFDFPVVTSASIVEIDDVKLPDSTEVLGVEKDGNAHAVVLDSLRSPKQHIVNLMLEQTPVSFSYCDRSDCVRVFSKDGGDSPIDLRVSGLDIHGEMVVLLNGERYCQDSPAIPLADQPFTRTTLGDWKAKHPSSLIYICDAYRAGGQES